MAKKEKMTEDDLKSELQQLFDDSTLYTTQIVEEREASLKFYMMQPLGNEVEGRSQVKTSDVADVIDWIMPQMQELLSGSSAPVEFVPSNADDIEQAKQETAYTRYVFAQENNGFLASYTWHKDALLQKNGVIKVWWDKNEDRAKETYENLNQIELDMLLQDDDVEEKDVTVTEEDGQKSFGAVVVRKSNIGRVKITNIAPENFFVARQWNSLLLEEAPYCAHREDEVSIASLRRDGVEEKVLDSLSGNTEDDITGEKQVRYQDQGGVDYNSSTKVRRTCTVTEHYVRIDYDGDGEEELRCVRVAGSGANSHVIYNEEVDSIPFFSITPNILTHRFHGRSVADVTLEIQKIKTALIRQVLDNIYLSNNPRPIVRKGAVKMDTLLTSKIGVPIMVDSIDAIRFDSVPFTAGSSLELFAYIDSMREERTGVSKNTQGLDPNSLKDQTLYAVSKLMSAAQQRILLIARIFAEVGYAPLYRRIQELVCKYEKNERIFEVAGEYVSVNPRTWRKRTNTRVLVGTGNNTTDMQLAAIQQVLAYQEKIIALQGGAMGIVRLENVYAALDDYCKLSGLLTTRKYFTSPAELQQLMASQPPAPPQTDPTTQIALADVQMRGEKGKLDAQVTLKTKEEELAVKREEIATKAMLEREKMAKEESLKNKELLLKAKELELKEAQAVSDVELELKKMSEDERRAQVERENQASAAAQSEGQNSDAIKMILQKLDDRKKTITVNRQKDGSLVGEVVSE
jgi:hypothetical protein